MTLHGHSAPVKAEMSVDAIVLHTKDGPQHCKIRLDKKKHIDKKAVEKHAKEQAKAHHRPPLSRYIPSLGPTVAQRNWRRMEGTSGWMRLIKSL